MACPVDAQLGGQGCQAAGVAPRGHGAAPPCRPSADRPGRTEPYSRRWSDCFPHSTDAVDSSRPRRCCAGAATWSDATGPTPPPIRPTFNITIAASPDPAAGSREPDVGLPPHPRGARPARLQAGAEHGVAAPQAGGHRPGATPCGADLAAILVHPSPGNLGLRPASTSTRCCSGACTPYS
jgi:hypothetical protein